MAVWLRITNAQRNGDMSNKVNITEVIRPISEIDASNQGKRKDGAYNQRQKNNQMNRTIDNIKFSIPFSSRLLCAKEQLLHYI